MRITRAKLHNYIGLQEGTGLDTINLDFRSCLDDNIKIFFFFGRNGSGKSTLVSALTPFAENFDGRSVQIVPGLPGLKEIELLTPEGTWYLAEHRWNAKGKVSSFLYQSDNPIYDLPEKEREKFILPETAKGNITTFRVELQRCLGITKEYLKIGRIGGRISSLLEMGASERKKFISGFMPILEDWQRMYKNSNQRLTLVNNEIRGITTELNSLPEETQLTERKKTLQGEVDFYVSKKMGLVEDHGVLTTRSEGFLNQRNVILEPHNLETNDDIFDVLTPKLEEAQRNEVNSEISMNSILNRNPSLKKYDTIESITNRLNEINTIKTQVETNLHSVNEKINDLETRSAEADARTSRAEESYEKIKTGKERYQALIEQKKEIESDLSVAHADLKKTGLLEKFSKIPVEELDYDNIKKAGEKLNDLVGDITQISTEITTKEAVSIAIDTQLDDNKLNHKHQRLSNRISTLKDTLDKKKAQLMSSEKEAGFYNRFEGKHCMSPSCPFERDIKDLGISKEDVGNRRKEIDDIIENIASNESQLEIVKMLRPLGQRMLRVYERALPYAKIYSRAGIKYTTWETFPNFLEFALSPEARNMTIQPLCDYAYHISVVNGEKDKLAQVNKTLEDLSSVSSTGDDLLAEIGRAKEISVREREVLDIARKERDDLDKKLAKCNSGISLFEELQRSYESQKEAQGIVKEIEKDSRDLRQIETEYRLVLKNIEDNLAIQRSTEEAESRARKGLGEVDLDIARRKDYEERVEKVKGRMTLLKAIVDGCHPAKGAPVHFVKSFLDQMRNDVNNMLDTAFNGEFRLDFILSESEFSMPVLRDSGRVIKDISEASEGQQALAKTVINLVTVQRTLSGQNGYNVVSLDEIDGALDREKNRERFVSIVEDFIEAMGLEQLFVISHNDAFHNTPAGLVLLPGHALPINDNEFMKDKSIIYESV